jgi:hypothetical protein
MERTGIRGAPSALRSDHDRPTFNLFRRRPQVDLLCAVPADYPVPRFLNAPTWEFVGTVREPATALCGFNRRAAETSARFNGCYLFEADLLKPGWITIACTAGTGEAWTPSARWMPDPAALTGATGSGAPRPEPRVL